MIYAIGVLSTIYSNFINSNIWPFFAIHVLYHLLNSLIIVHLVGITLIKFIFWLKQMKTHQWGSTWNQKICTAGYKKSPNIVDSSHHSLGVLVTRYAVQTCFINNQVVAILFKYFILNSSIDITNIYTKILHILEIFGLIDGFFILLKLLAHIINNSLAKIQISNILKAGLKIQVLCKVRRSAAQNHNLSLWIIPWILQLSLNRICNKRIIMLLLKTLNLKKKRLQFIVRQVPVFAQKLILYLLIVLLHHFHALYTILILS